VSSVLPAVSGWCTFTVADRLCGLEVTRVQEVLRPTPVTRLPLAPPAVRGLLNLRGRIVPAVDLRLVLGLPPAPNGTAGGHLIVFDGASPVSLVVDAIGDVQRAEGTVVLPVPHTLDGPARDLVAGAVPLPDGLLLVLDLDRTLDRAFAQADAMPRPGFTNGPGETGRPPRPAGGTP
jgi:purine-binding chemotaxis protein CheW